LKNIDYNNLLNDNNSKVWIINRQIVSGVNIADALHRNKDLIIFHDSGVVDVIPMKALGTKTGRKGNYYLNSEEKTLEFVFTDESWIMDLDYISEGSILMIQAKESDVEFDIQIMPLPELHKLY
jgi:hypothetical protein